MKKNPGKTPSRRDILEKAFSGINIKELAANLDTSPGCVYNIKYGNRQVSAVRAIKIEYATAAMGHKISRNILRPDIFGN